MEAKFEITEGLVTKLLGVVDAGLVDGMGKPEPGKMCVEAAVCYAMGLPHSDKPTCVSPALRALMVGLNDSLWSSDEARAKGLRRLAVAQLGSADVLDEKEFIRRVVDPAIRKEVPAYASSATYAAYAAEAVACVAYAAAAAADARDKHLSEFAEDVVQILIEMNVPGTEWLVLTEAA